VKGITESSEEKRKWRISSNPFHKGIEMIVSKEPDMMVRSEQGMACRLGIGTDAIASVFDETVSTYSYKF
jgi:hypothetical protein